jgi:uncharacterized protein YheU (UPF0270 family)
VSKISKAAIETRAKAIHAALMRQIPKGNLIITWDELSEADRKAARSQARAELEAGQ